MADYGVTTSNRNITAAEWTEAPSRASLRSELAALHDDVSQAEKLLDKLGETLDPVLRPSTAPVSNDAESPRETMSPLRDMVFSERDRLGVIVRRLGSLTERVEL